MAGEGLKKQCSLKSWCPIHVHTPTSMLSTLAGPPSQDGRWAHPKDPLHAELTTGARCKGHPNYDSRTYGSMTWKHATLTQSHGKPLQMTEPCGSRKCHKDWKERRLPSKKKWWKTGQENSQSSAGPPRPTSDICLHMPGLQQRLQIQDWPLQPHKTMLINNLSWHYSIFDQLMDAIYNWFKIRARLKRRGHIRISR